MLRNRNINMVKEREHLQMICVLMLCLMSSLFAVPSFKLCLPYVFLISLFFGSSFASKSSASLPCGPAPWDWNLELQRQSSALRLQLPALCEASNLGFCKTLCFFPFSFFLLKKNIFLSFPLFSHVFHFLGQNFRKYLSRLKFSFRAG